MQVLILLIHSCISEINKFIHNEMEKKQRAVSKCYFNWNKTKNLCLLLTETFRKSDDFLARISYMMWYLSTKTKIHSKYKYLRYHKLFWKENISQRMRIFIKDNHISHFWHRFAFIVPIRNVRSALVVRLLENNCFPFSSIIFHEEELSIKWTLRSYS